MKNSTTIRCRWCAVFPSGSRSTVGSLHVALQPQQLHHGRFHNKIEAISRVAYGFRNFENYRRRVKVLCSLGYLGESTFAQIAGPGWPIGWALHSSDTASQDSFQRRPPPR